MTRDGRRLDGGTGLARSTIITALSSLEQRGVVIAEHRMSLHVGHETTVYRLAVAPSTIRTTPPEAPPAPQNPKPTLVRKSDKGSTKIGPTLVRKSDLQETEGETEGYSASHEAGGDAAPAQKQKPRPTRPMRAKAATERPETPQYRVFLHLCRVVEAEVADMDGKKGRACAEAVRALRALSVRYAGEGHETPAEDAEADLCAMLTWKAGRMRAQRRDPAEMLTVQAAYADQAAWRRAGCQGRPEAPRPPQTPNEIERERFLAEGRELVLARMRGEPPPPPPTLSPEIRAEMAAATERAAALHAREAAARAKAWAW
jgi:hypothetical protein